MSDLKLFFCPPHPFIIFKLIPTHTESQTGKHTTQGSSDLNYGYVPDALRLPLPLIPPYFWLDIIESAAAYNEVNICFSFYLLSNQSHNQFNLLQNPWSIFSAFELFMHEKSIKCCGKFLMFSLLFNLYHSEKKKGFMTFLF